MTENNSNAGEEIEVVETDQDLSRELGFDIASAVFMPNDRTLNIEFDSSKNGDTTSSTSGDANNGKPNNNIEFVADGVAVHHPKKDPSMEIPEGNLDKEKKAAIKARAEKSKARKEQQEKEASERE